MAFINRFSTVTRGGISFIGNTLGLSKQSDTLNPGTQGSIGAFTTLNNTQVTTFPVGTTSNYLENGSTAVLSLPAGSTVLYAELIWGGLYKSTNNDISALIDNAVSFTTPSGSFSVSPDATTGETFSIPNGQSSLGFYVRTANVTNLVTSISGNYTTGGVPALIEALDSRTNDTNHAGWTLAVVYGNANETIRNLNLWVGGVVVGPNQQVTDVTLSGFLTPSAQPINAKVFMSAQEGDAVLEGDQFFFGKDLASLTAISGVNNPVDNFFSSQINDETGALKTSGTFGDRNASAQTGTNISAGRQGWDITAVDVSNQMEPSQSSAMFRFTSDQDLYVPNAVATQIDSLGAFLTATKSVDKTFAGANELINYTIALTNLGQINAENISVDDFLPAGLTLVPNSIRVDGVQVADSFPIEIASISPSQTVNITYSLVANTVPAINPAVNNAQVSYTFEPFEGFPVSVQFETNQVSVLITSPSATLVKSVDMATATTGDTLTYTHTHTNTGSQNMLNVVFTDTMPNGVEFIPGSVIINGVSAPSENPENGINLGTLVPNQSATVSFTANVTATENMNVDNFSTSNFAIQQPDGSTTPGSSTSNTITTNIVIEPNPPTPCIIVFECKCRSCCQPSYCGCDCHGCHCDRCKDCWKENCRKDCFDRCKDKWHGKCPNDKKCNQPIPSYTKCCQCKCRFRLKCCKDKNLNNLFDGISTLLNGIDQNTSTGLNYRTQTKFNIHSNCDRNVRRRNRY